MNMLNLVKKSCIALMIQSPLKIVLILFLIMAHCSAAFSAIVVQNGRGLVGVANKLISFNLSGSTRDYAASDPFQYVYLSYFSEYTLCGEQPMEIDGVLGVKFNREGTLMLVPEMTYIDNRTWSSGSDTVTAIFNGYGANTNENMGSNCVWSPVQTTPAVNGEKLVLITHHVTASGRMLIYGTGKQQSGNVSLDYPFKLMLRDPTGPGPYPSGIIVNTNIYQVVVSNLGCTLTTPTLVDFGPLPANVRANQELTLKTVNLSVSCQQSQNPIGAMLTLVPKVNSIYYSGDDYQVNLNNSAGVAGAYVKMDMDINGISTAIPFNRQPIDIGSITATQNATSFSYPVTYTLYSRGKGMTGKISGSIELSIVLR